MKYKHIEALGLKVVKGEHVDYVPRKELREALEAKGEAFKAKFHDLFGVQTCCLEGPYAWDVEAVLERMSTGKLSGSQLHWD